MKVAFTPRAYIDREAIYSYLNAHSHEGAKAVMAKLHHAIEHLSNQPLNGRETDMRGVRVLFVGKYPYKVFYTVDGDRIVILHFRHTAQQTMNFKNVA